MTGRPVTNDASRPGVLHVVITYCPGGGERAAIEIATRLASQFRIMACCLDEDGPWAHELTDRGIEVEALHRRPGFHPSLGWRIARFAEHHNIRVLHCHQYSPCVYGSIAALVNRKLRVVVTEQGRLSDAPPSRKRRIANLLVGRIPNRVFAVSSDLRLHLIREGFPADVVEVLHNSINPGPEVTSHERLEARRALNIADHQHVIGTVARLDPVKNLAMLIQAFARVRDVLPEAMLVIVGDGPERAHLEDQAARSGIRPSVCFTGHRDDARRILAAFDQYINCSVTEGTSLTIMEAMAASLPVVATDVGGNADIVAAGATGLLVPSRNIQALAEAMVQIATDPTRARGFAAAGRRRVEESFSIDGMVERYADAYRALLVGR